MCMHCSQFCDNCKPAELSAFLCETCGKSTILSRKECLIALGYWKEAEGEPHRASTCMQCGAALDDVIRREIEPLPCLYSGITCGYPCRRRERHRGPHDEPCRKQILAQASVGSRGTGLLGHADDGRESVAASTEHPPAASSNKDSIARGL